MSRCGDEPMHESLQEAFVGWICWLVARYQRLRRPGATITVVVVAAFGLVQVAKASDLPRESFWAHGHVGQWIYVALAAATTVLSLLVVLGYRARLKGQQERSRLEAAARGIVQVVEKNKNLSHDEIGVNIWVVHGRIKGLKRLERRAMVVASEREASPVTWVKGKGAIGRCWADDEPIFANLEELADRCPTREEWCKVPREQRFRFTWQEFEATRQYKAVLAVPLKAQVYGRWRVRGVLAIDVLAAGKGDEIKGIQHVGEFSGIKSTCQSVLSRGVED